MLISHLWLKEWIDHPYSPEELAEKLTALGLECAIADDKRGKYERMVVGKVESCFPHPNADKLKVTTVNVGQHLLSIVCGASNVKKGLTVAVAMVGATMPDGMKIGERKLRGEDSHGMICSESELEISDESQGIMELDDSLVAGTPLKDAIEIEDTILEIDLTPNRGDALSVYGIAREISAITGFEINMPKLTSAPPSGIDGLEVEIQNEKNGARYTAGEVLGVTVKPSPLLIRRRLTACGIRPINNIVDVTNYLMLEMGHPLHAFDKRDIAGGKIIIRDAKPNEKFISLDGKEHKLIDADLVIADEKKAVALAGIIGGQNSEVKDDTTDVIIEAAYFNPTSTRKTSRRLSLSTESSYRFERGVNPDTVAFAGQMTAQMIAELGVGKVGGFVDMLPKKFDESKTILRTTKVNSVLGTNLSQNDISAVLEKLGFVFETKNDGFEISIPLYRHDIESEVDFIEEVARIIGYGNIKATAPRLTQHEAKDNGSYMARRELNRLWASSSLNEAVNFSFINSAWRKSLGGNDDSAVVMQNPINADHEELRVSLLPGLLKNVSFNLRHGEEHVSLFETGAVYLLDNVKEKVDEEFFSAGLITGGNENLFGADIPRDFFRLKGIVSDVLKVFCGSEPVFVKPKKIKSFLYDHRQAEIVLNKSVVGFVGQLHPFAMEAFDITADTYCFEISIASLLESVTAEQTVKPIPKFPAIKRDIALIVDDDVEIGGIVETILATNANIIRDCTIFDLYKGEQVSVGKKSLAFKLFFQDDGATLTDEVADEVVSNILVRVKEVYNAELRG